MDFINIQNNLDNTALMCAIKNNHFNVITKMLYYSIINLNIKNNIGVNALIYAVKKKY